MHSFIKTDPYHKTSVYRKNIPSRPAGKKEWIVIEQSRKKSITRFQFTISSINIKVSSYRNLLANRNQAQTTRMVNEHQHKYNSPAGIATSSNNGCTKPMAKC